MNTEFWKAGDRTSTVLSVTDLQTDFAMRRMRPSDLDVVVQNEALAVAEHPWNKRVFIDCLRAGYQCWVLGNNDRLIGHGVMSVAIGESHLLTLCVHPDYQRAGHGRRILQFLLERAQREEAEVCYLEVRSSNETAKSLYRSMGFLPIGERKNYYPSEHGREDAIIMSRQLP
ncbi:MAG: ribosomal protein S18-alanine N-acetyltransferase [Gammaproteobacteria bacterium]|nr:ribosomal protein S18-alanine N-acetyltransferase [Gammaproteobacteria bacterium]